jgi:hypothetical protein
MAGILSDDAKTIYYSTTNKSHINNEDNTTTQVLAMAIDGKNKRVLYSGAHVYQFQLINNNILMAITTAGSLAFDLSTDKKVNPPYISNNYYNPYTKTVYWLDKKTGVLKRKKFN